MKVFYLCVQEATANENIPNQTHSLLTPYTCPARLPWLLPHTRHLWDRTQWDSVLTGLSASTHPFNSVLHTATGKSPTVTARTHQPLPPENPGHIFSSMALFTVVLTSHSLPPRPPAWGPWTAHLDLPSTFFPSLTLLPRVTVPAILRSQNSPFKESPLSEPSLR